MWVLLNGEGRLVGRSYFETEEEAVREVEVMREDTYGEFRVAALGVSPHRPAVDPGGEEPLQLGRWDPPPVAGRELEEVITAAWEAFERREARLRAGSAAGPSSG